MTQSTTFTSRPINQIPAMAIEGMKKGYQKVADWTHTAGISAKNYAVSAKNWAVSHKKEILTAIAVAGIAATLIGFGVIAASAASTLFSVGQGASSWFGWHSSFSFSQAGYHVSQKLMQGLMLVAGGGLITAQANKANRAIPKEGIAV